MKSERRPIREVAREFQICHVSLYRYCKKNPMNLKRDGIPIFSEELEQNLVKYLLQASDLYYGLSPKEVRRFAFKCATSLGVKVPKTWNENGMAGADWFPDFLKGHSELSIRKPQPTSLARATSFNKVTVNEFFDNFESVRKRFKFEPKDIYNMDETGVTTVQMPDHIIGRRGEKTRLAQ